ncbi:hypothetical protein [Aliivibrio wodanis]|uniref:hypothetical protein n=1 Tax=Aliivibrio wodanis TaxID=80852 RepID=UPI00406CB2AB
MEQEEQEYRNLLISTKHQLTDSYDKLVVTLSGGALALSITFLKDIVNLKDAEYIWMLITAWSGFIFSLAFIFGGILFGIHAYRKALAQFDSDSDDETVGGIFSSLAVFCSYGAAVSLIIGLMLISIFVFINIGDTNGKGSESSREPTEATTNTKTDPTTSEGSTSTGHILGSATKTTEKG